MRHTVWLIKVYQIEDCICQTARKDKLLSFQLLLVGWLVGCFGFNGPLRQYFSLYRAVSQREGEISVVINQLCSVHSSPWFLGQFMARFKAWLGHRAR